MFLFLSFVLFAKEEVFCLDDSIKSDEDIRLIASINFEKWKICGGFCARYELNVDNNKLRLKYDYHNIYMNKIPQHEIEFESTT